MNNQVKTPPSAPSTTGPLQPADLQKDAAVRKSLKKLIEELGRARLNANPGLENKQ